MHTLHQTREGGNYQVKDPEKLIRIAKEWGVETEGKDIYALAHEMAEIGLLEYGKPFGTQKFLKRAPEHTQELWAKADIEPRAIDREVSQSMHMTHMGCSSLAEALIRQALRAGLSDGWGGSMMGHERGTNSSLITFVRSMMQTALGEMIIKREIEVLKTR